MKKVFITGASGLLGKYLVDRQPREKAPVEGVVPEMKYELVASYREHRIDGVKMDVSIYSETIDTLFTHQPDIIIHCAANGNVDAVQSNPAKAVKSDLLGTTHLKDYCEKMGCKLVVLSTNAVYEGNHPPYTESAPRNPVNFYGKIKSLADDVVMSSSCDWMIIRPILMYGTPYPHGRSNWVLTIIDKLTKKEEVRLVDDSYTQPVYVGDVADIIWSLIDYHNK